MSLLIIQKTTFHYWLKKYLGTKFKSANLTIVGIKNFIKSCLRELKIIFDIKEKAELFDEWILFHGDLCQVDNHARNPVQTPTFIWAHLRRLSTYLQSGEDIVIHVIQTFKFIPIMHLFLYQIFSKFLISITICNL